MLDRYRAVLTLPGARGPVAASALGSLPIGMFGLAILLLAREETGSFAVAGRVAGAFGLANAIGAVVQGRLMDRLGQRRVLRPASVAHFAAVGALVAVADAGAPFMAIAAAAGGFTLPQVPAAMRSVWGELVRTAAQRQAAYALVSITFEVAVMTAPVLVAVVTEVAGPGEAVLLAAALCSAGGLAFSVTGASRRWRGEPHDVSWLGPLSAGGMQALLAVLLAFGVALGIVQVAVPAFAAAHGSAAAGGLLLGALSVGNLTGGVVYGARSWPGTPAFRLTVLLLALGAGLAFLSRAGSPAILALQLALAGLVLAPSTVVGSTLLDHVAPPGTTTEAFAVLVMGIVAGSAAGNALGGALVDGASYEAATLTAGALAVAGGGLAWVLRRPLTGSSVAHARP
ncbi:MFS transporter [Solirubrobacter soli]|uniref:MFS transporter n=1 Tax=Solirubrobacter soli TaxID=363832 RepID=UPI00042A852D|nr:MFS transporter [Solirubrobacter soli]